MPTFAMVECLPSFANILSIEIRSRPIACSVIEEQEFSAIPREDVYDDVESYRAGRRAISIARGLLQEERNIPTGHNKKKMNKSKGTTTTSLLLLHLQLQHLIPFTPPTPTTPTRTTSTFACRVRLYAGTNP